MYRSSADFCSLFLLKDKLHKTFDTIVFKKCCFSNFLFWGFGGVFEAAARQPPPLMCTFDSLISVPLHSYTFSSFVVVVIVIIIILLFFNLLISINLT